MIGCSTLITLKFIVTVNVSEFFDTSILRIKFTRPQYDTFDILSLLYIVSFKFITFLSDTST